jgi:hypothetical protein
MQTINLWRFWLPDIKGGLKPSRWRTTEAEAQARDPGRIKVEGSLEVRQIDAFVGHSMPSGFVRRADGATVLPSE